MSDTAAEYANFAYYYDLYFSQVERDHNFYLELLKLAGEKPHVLELACGTGRLLLPLVKAGYRVTGLDLSEEMLAIAREKIREQPAEIQERVQLVYGDMRHPLETMSEQKFDFIILGFNSFQHLKTEDEQLSCLKETRRLLAPGGFFVTTVDNATPEDVPEEKLLKYYGTFPDPRRNSRVTLMVSFTDYPHHHQSLRRYMFYEKMPDSANEMVCDATLTLRYFFVDELQSLLEQAGFEILNLYGSYQFEEYSPESSTIAFVCRSGEGS
jgi:SAM-dependent methyltransferase